MMFLKHHWLKVYLVAVASWLLLCATIALAETIPTLGGSADGISKLTAAGTLLRIVDSFLFSFGARLMAGLAVLGAGWNLKEQRFAMAIICIIAAIMMGTVPMWIKNIFEMDGSGGTIFR
jgi:hypothetical protein